MARPSFRDRALVVGTHDFGEADRIVVLLTRTHGVVRTVAKGVRRSTSRFGSRLQPFVIIDVQLYQGKNLHSLTGADTVEFLAHGIIDDYARYTAAAAALQAARRFSVSDEQDPYLFDQSCHTLRRMQDTANPQVVLDTFLLQIMNHEGVAPSLFDCGNCGAAGPHHAFVPAAGGAVCGSCRPPGTKNVATAVLRLMWLLAHGQEDAAGELLVGEEGTALGGAMHQLVDAYVTYQLGGPLRALRLVED
ncbi:DNA repair protein RecO [Corynebacterium sp. 13CS0277]|uniref:DNA repair protein RecO n=1 Tax=Corynebacterium sp. 13CS0277 TaxID=2071994 RepID=UPI000D023C48|nr:DNA repair protein RecO [Corynebacterium sp. 13CS0277]PRQ10914.1 DNA repair protein RecO [Corynebacterium sp. 13CS0277]